MAKGCELLHDALLWVVLMGDGPEALQLWTDYNKCAIQYVHLAIGTDGLMKVIAKVPYIEAKKWNHETS